MPPTAPSYLSRVLCGMSPGGSGLSTLTLRQLGDKAGPNISARQTLWKVLTLKVRTALVGSSQSDGDMRKSCHRQGPTNPSSGPSAPMLCPAYELSNSSWRHFFSIGPAQAPRDLFVARPGSHQAQDFALAVTQRATLRHGILAQTTRTGACPSPLGSTGPCLVHEARQPQRNRSAFLTPTRGTG